MRRTLCTMVLAGLAAAAPAAAAKDALKRVEDMSRIALEELDLGDAAAAEMRLDEAIAVAKASGLAKHAATARALLYLAAAQAAQKNKVDAVKNLRAALVIDPRLVVPDKLKTPELNAVLAEARGFAEPTPAPAAPGAAPGAPIPAPQGGIQHIPVDSASAGKPVAVEAQVGADVRARKVVLFFKAENAKAFRSVPMKNVSGVIYRADIPADATGGATVAYYIDARNAKAKVVATRGTASKPYVVSVVHAAKVMDVKEEDKKLDDEDPLKEAPKK